MAVGNQDKLVYMGNVGRRAAEFADEAVQRFADAERQVMRYAAQRKLNLEMLLGEQWSSIRESDLALVLERDVRRAMKSNNVELISDNVLSTLLVNRVSQVIGTVPVFEGVPTSAEQVDMAKAKYVTKMAPAFWYHLKAVSFFRKMHIMAGYYNCAFGKVGWSKTMGEVVNGRPQGEVSLTAIPPFHIFVDPDAERVMPRVIDEETDARWLFYRKAITLGGLKDAMHKPGGGKTPTGGSVVWCDPPDNLIRPASNSGEVNASQKLSDRSIIRDKFGVPGDMSKLWGLEYYEQPSVRYGRGRYALMLPDYGNHIIEYRECLPDDAVLYGKQLPGLFGFFMVWDEQAPGQLAGRSRTAAAIPHQRAINRTATEWNDLDRKHQPKMFIDHSTGIDYDGVVDDPRLGLVIPLDSRVGGELPKTDWPPEIRSYDENSMNKINYHTRRAEDRMCIHSLAYYPRRSLTATEVVNAMRYDQDARVQEAYIAEECAYIPATNLVLQEVIRHYGEERVISFLADRNRMEVQRVLASDLQFKDVIITAAGSSVPMNRRLMKAEVLELVKVGYFSDPDPVKAEKKQRWLGDLMQLESSVEMGEDDLDNKNARAENMELLAGRKIPPPGPDDNDAIHLLGPLCHLALGKTPEFCNLKDPARRAAILFNRDAHVRLHQERMNQDAEKLRDAGVANPEGQLMQVGLGRVRPGLFPPGGPQAQAAGPVTTPPQPGRPTDVVGPDGVRIYRQAPGPKGSNQVGPKKEPQ